jgi:putative ABC transport system permease protein
MLNLLRHGLRAWSHSKGVALLAIAALTVGIGSATAIFTVIHAWLLKPLPYANPERYFYVLGAWHNRADKTSFSYPDEMDFAARVRTVDAFGCTTRDSFNVTFNGQPLHVRGTEASAGLIQSAGVNPVMGRWFNDGSQEPGGVYVVVLANSLWKRLGSDPRILGKTLNMDGASYNIVGVMPETFRFPVDAYENDLWVPLNPDANQRANRDFHYLMCTAKLKAGVPLQQMEQDFGTIQAQLQGEHGGQQEADTVMIESVLKLVLENIRPTLLLLLGAAAALLLISCANVASLLLTRSVARSRETAVRVALGATVRQLGAQFFSEGLLVSFAGAVVGAVASVALVRGVLSLLANDVPRNEPIGMNGQILAFTLGVAVFCSLIFSLAPLWQAGRTPPQEVLSDGTRASAGARSRGLLRIFVVAEIALAFGLVAIAGLLVERLGNLYHVKLGFDPSHVLTLEMVAPVTKYRDDQARVAYLARLLDAVRGVPGVESAGLTSGLPLVGPASASILWREGEPEPDFTKATPIGLVFASPEYFRTLSISLVAGRFLNDADRDGKTMPILVNQAAVRRFWPRGDPLGSLARISSFNDKDIRLRVVGIVGDLRNSSLNDPPRPEIYLSFRYVPPPEMEWVVRSQLDPGTLVRDLRQAVQRVDPEQSIFRERPMEDIVAESLSSQRLQAFMVSFFAVSALLLSILGVYGVVSYSVRQRTSEIGTRMALGATSRDLIGLVVGDGLKMAGIGIAAGVVMVLAAARILESTGLNVQFSSASTLFLATALTTGFTALACFVQGWQATTLSPLIAIRNEPDTMWARIGSESRRWAGKLSEWTARPEEHTGELELLTAIVDSSRRAESFALAIQSALSVLRQSVGAEFTVLLTAHVPGEAYRCVAAAPESYRKDWSLPADALILGRLRYYSAALPISGADIDTWLRWAEEQAPQRVVEIQTLKEMGVALAAAVADKSETVGLLLLGPPVNRPPYSSQERSVLRSVGAQLALLLENSRLTDRIVEQERLRRELLLATEVQKRLFPDKLPETAAVHCAGLCIPARGVGGDYYDFLDLGRGQIGIAVADVAGKGIAAALVMSVVQASLRSLADTGGPSLADLATKMNRLLHRSTGTNSYATFFYAQFDEENRQLRYVNAGHNPPFLLRSGGDSIEELSAGGTIIGMFPVARYEEAVVDLHPGDVLLAFTDGVSEAHDPKEDEFGEDRLKDLLRRSAHLPVREMSSKILDELKVWMADAEQFDDLTFLVIKVR